MSAIQTVKKNVKLFEIFKVYIYNRYPITIMCKQNISLHI